MNKNTPDEMIEVIQAHKLKKKLQFWSTPVGHDIPGQWCDASEQPLFDFSSVHYRVKPKVKKVPLTQADIPLDRPVWIKLKGRVTSYLVTSVYPGGLSIADSVWEFQHLINDSISFDGGKTWQKCEKEVVE